MKKLILALALLAAGAPAGAAQSGGTPPPAAPSVAETPPPAVQQLRRDIERILSAPGWSGHAYGVMVVSLDRGDTLFSINPDLPLSPASNAKLFTTAAALHYLGEEFRFSTFLLADGPIREGVLHGDLILHGTGDPSISRRLLHGPDSVLLAMADSLVAAGVREIRGDVVGDGSYFDDEWVGPGWQDNDFDHWYGAPVGALSIAENVVSIRFVPSARGRPAGLRTTPETRGLAIENRVTTVGSGASRVSFQRIGDRLVATGQVRAGGPGLLRTVPVVDPANYAAAALRAALEQRGITVDGAVRTVYDRARSRVSFVGDGMRGTSETRLLAVHRSPPLRELAAVTNRVSHNLFAEALLKAVGRAVGGAGTYHAGVEAVRHFLATALGEQPDLWLVDGSGLSRTNRLTARTTIRLLDYMTGSEVWGSYLESLPLAGRMNGLEHRMRGSAAAANLRAKTGTVRHVSALSGYVLSADGERLAFSILGNGVPSTARAKRSEDAIGARLAAFSRSSAAPGTPISWESPRSSAPTQPSRFHHVSTGDPPGRDRTTVRPPVERAAARQPGARAAPAAGG